jgi:hypothetical protein
MVVLAVQAVKESPTQCAQDPLLSMGQAVADKAAGQMVSVERMLVTEAELMQQVEQALTVSTKRAVAAVLAGAVAQPDKQPVTVALA